jgi:hypothetical protein
VAILYVPCWGTTAPALLAHRSSRTGDESILRLAGGGRYDTMSEIRSLPVASRSKRSPATAPRASSA